MYNLHSVLGFGKHKNRPIWVVVVCDPTYLDWCIKNIEDFCINNLELLETIPRVFSDDPMIAAQIKERVQLHPEIYQVKSPPQAIEDYYTERGYDSFLENYKPFMHKTYNFKEEVITINNQKCEKQRAQKARDDSYYDSGDSSEKYTFDDTINDAFEGDYSNYWNVD